MRTFVLFTLCLMGTAIVTDDALAFGRRHKRGGCDSCGEAEHGYGASYAGGCSTCGGYAYGGPTYMSGYAAAPCNSCGGSVSAYGGVGYGYGNSYYGAGYPAGYGVSMYGTPTPGGYMSPYGAGVQGGAYNIPSPTGGVPQSMPGTGNVPGTNNPNLNPVPGTNVPKPGTGPGTNPGTGSPNIDK